MMANGDKMHRIWFASLKFREKSQEILVSNCVAWVSYVCYFLLAVSQCGVFFAVPSLSASATTASTTFYYQIHLQT